MSDPVPAIEVNHLSKCYKIYSKPLDLALDVLNIRKSFKEHWALQDINFTVQKGEVVGILGVNGSGKSTLLKILSGKLEKSSGNYHVNGQISSILELGTGFHPHYSGRENSLMGSMCAGLSKEQALEKMDWIIDFSGLHDVIDQPFNTYSSGMQARLTFATAVSIDPDIFIVDEALATGDAFFSAKCLNRMHEICKRGTTALFVSHASHTIIQLCSRALWIHQGKLMMDGPALEVVREYEYFGHQKNSIHAKSKMEHVIAGKLPTEEQLEAEKSTDRTVFRRGPYLITKVLFLNEKREEIKSIRVGETLIVEVHYDREDANDEDELFEDSNSVGISATFLRKTDLLKITNFSTKYFLNDHESAHYHAVPYRKDNCKRGVITASMDVQLAADEYYISLGLVKNDPVELHFYELRYLYYDFTVLREGCPHGGMFIPKVNFEHVQLEKLSQPCASEVSE